MPLPPLESERLLELYENGDRVELKRYIAALRANKWTLQAVAETLGVSKSTVQYWERHAKGVNPEDAPLSPRGVEVQGVKTVKWRTHVPTKDVEHIAYLAQQARKVRSQTPAGSQLYKDAEMLDFLIQENLTRMVSVTELAGIMGVTNRAVKARIERRAK